MKGDLITTHTDRLWHMRECQKKDLAWWQDRSLAFRAPLSDNIGDIATVNDWMYHHPKGHCVFYDNTPDWIVGIAVCRGWISERGELTLCVNCNNVEGGCEICCPEAYAGGAV